MVEETTFFQNGNIAVTNTRFIVGGQTFAISGITSVQGIEKRPGYVGPILLITLGCIFALGFFFGEFGLGVFGLLFFIIGILLITIRKSIFEVVLRTAGGEITALKSKNRDFISQVIQALNTSIISRG